MHHSLEHWCHERVHHDGAPERTRPDRIADFVRYAHSSTDGT